MTWKRLLPGGMLLLAMAGLSACTSVEEFVALYVSPTPTATASSTPSVTASPSPTDTSTPSETPLPSPSATSTATPTNPPTDTAEPPPTLPPEVATLVALLPPLETFTPTAGEGTASPGLPPTITRTPTKTRRPSLTPSITPSKTPTLTPTATFTPTPPFATLRLQRPGSYSKVLSPFQISAVISPGEDGYLDILLLGEDGRTITGKHIDYHQSTHSAFLISPLVEFAIPGPVETGRLILQTYDFQGRLMALSSVDLLLLSLGSPEIFAVPDLTEPYLVRSPKKNQVVSGGLLQLQALARPLNGNPLIVELVDEQHKVVARESVVVPAPSGGLSHTPFDLNIPYSIEERTPVRMTLRQESAERLPGTIALVSLQVVLEP